MDNSTRPSLRRLVLERLRFLNERTERLEKALAVVFVVSFALPRVLDVSELIKRLLEVVDLVIGIGLLAYAIARRVLLRNPLGRIMTKENCKLIYDWLRTGKAPPGIDRSRVSVVFSSPDLLETIVKLNYEGFQNSAFRIEIDRLRERNASWIERNPKVFMLMADPLMPDDYIGYSCLLPLNRDGAELYLGGKLKDADIPVSLLASPTERPSAVIVFAIVLKDEYSFSKDGADRRYSYYFWACIRHHIIEFYRDLSRTSQLPSLYAQTETDRMRSRLENIGFASIHKKSADGFDLLELSSAGLSDSNSG